MGEGDQRVGVWAEKAPSTHRGFCPVKPCPKAAYRLRGRCITRNSSQNFASLNCRKRLKLRKFASINKGESLPDNCMRPSDNSPSRVSNPSKKHSDMPAGAGVKTQPSADLSNDQVTIQPFKVWDPPRMKTGLRNHPIGRKVPLIILSASR
jgi:hypothetical protein